jgi:hypothetical protein
MSLRRESWPDWASRKLYPDFSGAQLSVSSGNPEARMVMTLTFAKRAWLTLQDIILAEVNDMKAITKRESVNFTHMLKIGR